MIALSELERGTEGILIGIKKERKIHGISIDSRTMEPGNCFVAIRGKRFDGHRFLSEAKAKGASAFVVERNALSCLSVDPLENMIGVQDTTLALAKLAGYLRDQAAIPACAITGSCGKTTTKEMAHQLLRQQFNVLATPGNLNNQFGLPLTLCQLSLDHEVILAELGASRPGDIAFLASILKPNVGLVTNIYPAHLEGFGSLEKVYEAKLELADAIQKRNGFLVVNGDDIKLLERAKRRGVQCVSFGRGKRLDYHLSSIEQKDDDILFEINGEHRFHLANHPPFDVDNALAAISLAHRMGIPWELIQKGLDEFSSLPGRFELKNLGNEIWFIHDAYNANVGSVKSSLKAFAELRKGRRKVVVLGDMMELGDSAEEFHRAIGRELEQYPISVLVTVGSHARLIADEARHSSRPFEFIYSCVDNKQAIEILTYLLESGDFVLLKGSRAMKLEEVFEGLQKSAWIHETVS